MAIGIDELDDDDIYSSNEPLNNLQLPSEGYVKIDNSTSEESLELNDDTFMLDFLRSKGIDDPSKIKFEDDNGNIEERNWNNLTREELINILNTPLTTSNNNNDNLFDDEEITLLNTIRQSGLTPSQFIQLILGELVIQEPTYKIDELSDDEVYVLDLESRVGELSDDEAVQALNAAKQNEDFFKKQVEGIRKEYKEKEDYLTQQKQAILEQEQQEAFDKYQASIVDAIDNFESIGNLDLNFEDLDKEELASFMLSPDDDGLIYFYKALLDPETLVKAAWFILNGDKAFNDVSDYFVNLIKLVSLNQYKKGYEDAKNGTESRKPSVVILKSNKTHQTYNTIDDLDDE